MQLLIGIVGSIEGGERTHSVGCRCGCVNCWRRAITKDAAVEVSAFSHSLGSQWDLFLNQ